MLYHPPWDKMIPFLSNVTTFAGMMDSSGFSDGQGTSASFYGPVGLTIDPHGYLYVTDQRNHSIRMIDPSESRGDTLPTRTGAKRLTGRGNK